MRDNFEIVQQWATRPSDIHRAMLNVMPQIVHFSGHGQGEEGLVFEDESGLPRLVSGEALAVLFELFSDDLRCVVLNGCYSDSQAKLISRHVDYVIGMRWQLTDRAAIAFAVAFYDALGAGRDVEFAFELACASSKMEGYSEEITPVLLSKQSAESKQGAEEARQTSAKDECRQPTSERRLKIFLSYSHADEPLLVELNKHLSQLRRQQVIEAWYDRDIAAGTEWAGEIDDHLETADLILLLVSPDFLASDYCYDVELKRAMQRHSAGAARVVPIILRPVDWVGAPFGRLQALPSDAKPVTSWANRDLALLSVAKGIRTVCEEILRREVAEKSLQAPSFKPRVRASGEPYKLYEVFKTAGIPTVTFVEPERFHLLKLALAQPGVGVIIEGPSGIGKSTALRHALREIDPDWRAKAKELSARNPADAASIRSLRDWHDERLAVIDDFHRLKDDVQREVVYHLKSLADNETGQKLVIIGIPSTGKRLVKLSSDIATRIKLFRLGRVTDETVLKMIKRGEDALNVAFDHKAEIARSASGSLNVAQLLCYHLAARQGIEETQPVTEILSANLEAAISEVMEGELALKFEDTIRCFVGLDGQNGATCLEILNELARSQKGYLSLRHFKDSRPDLSEGLEKFIREEQFLGLYRSCPESEGYLLYDPTLSAIIVDDPQLTFYLANAPLV